MATSRSLTAAVMDRMNVAATTADRKRTMYEMAVLILEHMEKRERDKRVVDQADWVDLKHQFQYIAGATMPIPDEMRCP